ncbi:putative small auxin-up RNA [Lupinus albus]|uniref:Putative small auxin-up RNA n=1 Tax=Lupinus albus TaxID=3870 RepID=A0A6A4NPH5_LUPAL|nr:putative small auxin-up RNA [Lupinus albus]
MSMDPKKSNKIIEIVRLQLFHEKWRKQVNSSKTNTTTGNNISSKSIKFMNRTLSLSENKGEESNNIVVPKGYLSVFVGENMKSFIIPTEYLNHQAF